MNLFIASCPVRKTSEILPVLVVHPLHSRARYYNPTIGVFLSEDPVYLGVGTQEPQKVQNLLQDPAGINSYAYARNNPIALIDPDGNWFTNPTLLNKILSLFGFGEHAVERIVVSVVADQVSQPVTVDTLTEHMTNVALGVGGIRPVVGSVVNSLSDDVARVARSFDWGKVEKLESHFIRHGADFGSQTMDDYARKAREFYQRGMNDLKSGIEVKTGPDDMIRMYDKSTNTFGSYNSDGSTATFFKPDRGESYWADQRSR